MPLLCRRPALFTCDFFEDRGLADGKDPTADELGGIEEMGVPQADALDQIDELTVVISPRLLLRQELDRTRRSSVSRMPSYSIRSS